MIVVLPVCSKDADAALRNLAWIRELDGKSPFHCIVSRDSSFDATAVLEAARLAFENVTEFVYAPPMPQPWPFPQNAAFRAAALHMHFTVRQPWLWWEQDAIPIRKGWLGAIASGHAAAGKPFFGALCTLRGSNHLTGIAVYPPNVPQLAPNMTLAGRAPFDAVCGENVLKRAAITELIQVNNSGEEVRWETPEDLERINPETALYHRCKDGSLIECLRNRQPSEPKVVPPGGLRALWNRLTSTVAETPAEDGEVTVVITNYQRPQMLWQAFQSCKTAGLKHIVVSSSGATPEVEEVHARIREAAPQTVILSEREDSGSNANWLRGVEAAKTKWVQILHDDDRLLPDYQKIKSQLASADFLCWSAKTHGNSSGLCQLLDLPFGVHQTSTLKPQLLSKRLSVSPVAGCFQRSHLVDVLTRCKNLGKDFYYRGNLLVGNDLLIWLEATRRYRTFNYLATPLTSFGCHPGSATVNSLNADDGKLIAIYKRTKDLWATEWKASQRLALPMVTLIGLDTWRPLQTLRALRKAQSIVEFGDAVLVTTPKAAQHINGIRVIDPIANDARVLRERYLVTRMTEAFSTPYCLHMESDARIANASCWTDEWLQYDYIGAPWPYPHTFHGKYKVTANRCVGNSGFCLMSKRFADAISRLPAPSDAEVLVSDVFMSIAMRPILEELGIRFAPEKVAARFSCECRRYSGQFGWHGAITARMNKFEL